MASKGVVVSDVKIDGESIVAPVVEDAPVEALAVEADETTELSTVEEIISAAQREDRELTQSERRQILDYSYPLPENFPNEDQLHEWEAQYGKIMIHRVAPNEAYVLRSLSRGEFRIYANELEKRFGANLNTIDARLTQEEMLVQRCTLWPVVTTADVRGETTPLNKVAIAGTITVLAYDIQEISNLIDSTIGPIEEV